MFGKTQQNKSYHVGFFREFTKVARRVQTEFLFGIYSIKGKAQYFFIVESTLYLKFRWASKWSGVHVRCSAYRSMRRGFEDYLCQTHSWSLLKTQVPVPQPQSALFRISGDVFWKYAFCSFTCSVRWLSCTINFETLRWGTKAFED